MKEGYAYRYSGSIGGVNGAIDTSWGGGASEPTQVRYN
jgi:hypothetical protein